MTNMIEITRGSFRAKVLPENAESVQRLLELSTDKLAAKVGSRKGGSQANPHGKEIRDAIKSGIRASIIGNGKVTLGHATVPRERMTRLEIVQRLSEAPYSKVPYWAAQLAWRTADDGLHHFPPNDGLIEESHDE